MQCLLVFTLGVRIGDNARPGLYRGNAITHQHRSNRNGHISIPAVGEITDHASIDPPGAPARGHQ